MLKYQRNKLVSVDKSGHRELKVRGILDDDLYGLEMEVVFGLEELDIRSISGKWNRWTTPECPRAIDRLQDAVGFKVVPGFRACVQKVIGRGACRHFANLLLEMGHAAKSAALVIGCPNLAEQAGQTQVPQEPRQAETIEPPREKTAGALSENQPASTRMVVTEPDRWTSEYIPEQSRSQPNRMVIDLHVHTSPASPCSSIPVEDIIAEAKTIGLDGIVLTDHNFFWEKNDLEDLRQKFGFLVLGGNEIITDQGDVLTFGLHHNISGVIRLPDLRAEVQAAGGYMAMAHPFRGFLIFSGRQLGMTVDKAAERSMFQWVDAVEVLNGKVTEQENEFSLQVAARIGLPGIAGSDTHESSTVGTYATEFSATIRNESDLVAALHSGGFRAVRFRKNKNT